MYLVSSSSIFKLVVETRKQCWFSKRFDAILNAKTRPNAKISVANKIGL